MSLFNILCGYKKNNKNTTNKISNKNLPENAVEALKPYFSPKKFVENMFDCAFLRGPIMWYVTSQ